ncbi:hypothetical protein PZN02_002097 [Sinorhizobium garamanticum]|uniref:Uncharacterized protein n=1 Tax=Sinorhizobium garamanticum TaxID=680247 RepID=A0ABY8D4T0_9HYPH|nr:hypothetical protein [Sinorhizobium garamanticum]WEX85861.1 hypothetical protein PZN02_002097 [Sinorhizobium garamanticum]
MDELFDDEFELVFEELFEDELELVFEELFEDELELELFDEFELELDELLPATMISPWLRPAVCAVWVGELSTSV